MQHKPNILLITTDTQRCDTLRCMGNNFAISPNLDRLADEGVLFTHAHTSSPVCMPARCSLLTGLHTPVHGCIENGISRRENIPVFTDFLKEQGYTTIMVGKTHFDPIPDSFDIKHVILGEKHRNSNDCYARHIRAYGYERFSSYPNPIPEGLFMDAFLIDTTINEIDTIVRMKSGPFFAFCSLPSPHSPLDPPGKWGELYDSIQLPEINYIEGELENHPIHLKRLVGTLVHQRKTSKEIDEMRRLYYGLAAYCDDQIGRLIQYLDESGIRENTLVIFTSDHGQQLYDHGFDDKHNYYDSSWRIPFIMSMPGTLPAGEKRDFSIWNDIPATILASAGTECRTMQGFDLFTPLKKGRISPRRCTVGTLYKSAALATSSWKLEYYFEESTGRLFDRKNDPMEQTDLYQDDKYRSVAYYLTKALLTWRSDICDVNHLIENSSGGLGPVAKRITPYTKSMKGTDAEERLNKAVTEYS